MRCFRSRGSFGILCDVVLFGVLLCLIVVFLGRRGNFPLPHVEISFQTPYDDADFVRDQQQHQAEQRRREDYDLNAKKTENLEIDDVVDETENNVEDREVDDLVDETRGSRGRLAGKRKPTSRPTSFDARIGRLPDARPSWCLNETYEWDKLHRSTTLVIQFTDYEFYDVDVTLSSLFHNVDQSDREALVEIILVDAASTLDHVRSEADKYVESMRSKARAVDQRKWRYVPPVRLLRVDSLTVELTGDSRTPETRNVWPRTVGMKAAKTKIVVFVDPGVVIGRGWLPPLISPLVAKQRARLNRDFLAGRVSAIESHLDQLRSPINLDYVRTDENLVPVPSWSLSVRMRRLPLSTSERKSESSGELVTHRAIPVLRGSAFAVNVNDVTSIGGLFDDKLSVDGGGEHLELSLRLWMCGLGIQATCSRVGVPDLDDEVRVVSPINARRLTETWFSEHKTLVARFGEHSSLDQSTDNITVRSNQQKQNVAVVQSVALNREKCKNMEWFLKTAAMGSLLVPTAMDSIRLGLLQVQSGACARVGHDQRIDLDNCNSHQFPQPDLVFELRADGKLIMTSTGRCLMVVDYYVVVEQCKVSGDLKQKWNYNTASQELINEFSKHCATHVTDPDQRYKGRQVLMAQHCRQSNEKFEPFKKWRFILP